MQSKLLQAGKVQQSWLRATGQDETSPELNCEEENDFAFSSTVLHPCCMTGLCAGNFFALKKAMDVLEEAELLEEASWEGRKNAEF